MTAACLAPGAFFVVYGLAVYDDDQELGHFFGSLEIAVGLLLMLGGLAVALILAGRKR